jgi:hypothetical protein
MTLRFRPSTLQPRHVFAVAANSRTTTPGVLTESSCGISAASHPSPKVDGADPDGAFLIANDIFDRTTIVNGKVALTNRPGIGVVACGA